MQLTLEIAEFEEVVEKIVREVIAQRETQYGDRLAFREAEAARMIGVHQKVLAEERRLGRIGFTQVGVRGGTRATSHVGIQGNGILAQTSCPTSALQPVYF